MTRLLAAAALLAVLPAARADRLDSRLLEEAPKIAEKIKARGWANVGVLRFAVSAPGLKSTHGSPLSGSIASRLETGLILFAGTDKPDFGVLRDPGAVASKARSEKLFDLDYPLAWGDAKAKPDALLSGTVAVAADRSKAEVRIQASSKAAPDKPIPLASFDVPVDTGLLRDLGHSFALSRTVRARAIKVKAGDDDMDKEAIKAVEKKPPEVPPAKDEPKAVPNDVGGVEVEMLVDGKSSLMRGKAGDPVAWEVDCPVPGKPLAFRLTNHNALKVGVVLRLNGVNIVNMQTHEPENCGKVILDPGKSTVLKGFYMIEGTGARAIRKPDEDPKPEDPKPGKSKIQLIPFAVLVGDDAKAAKDKVGTKAGLIEVDVFESGSAAPRGKVSMRGLPPDKEEKVARETYKGLRTALLQSSGLKTKKEPPPAPGVKSREIIVPKEDAEREDIKGSVEAFPNPLRIAALSVRVVPSDSDPRFSDK